VFPHASSAQGDSIIESRQQQRLWQAQAQVNMADQGNAAAQVNFAIAPGRPNNTVLDCATSKGVKLYGKAVVPLDPMISKRTLHFPPKGLQPSH
jgi:hypothetical protein